MKNSENIAAAMAEIYDKYVKTETYDNQYDERVILNDRLTINKVLDSVVRAKQSNQILLMDYGCGTGRYINIWLEAAERYLEKEFVVINYEISKEAILKYIGKFLGDNKENFIYDYKTLNNEKNTYIRGVKIKNTTMYFLHGNENFPFETVYDFIKKSLQLVMKDKEKKHYVDVSFMMFGVLSHIPSLIENGNVIAYGDQRRVDCLKMLRRLSKSHVVFTVPSIYRWKEIFLKYELMLKENGPSGLIQQSGDLYYQKNIENNVQEIFYAVYSYKNLSQALNSSSLEGKIMTNCFLDVQTLLAKGLVSVLLNYVDAFFSRTISEISRLTNNPSLIDNFSCYVHVVATPKLDIEERNQKELSSESAEPLEKIYQDDNNSPLPTNARKSFTFPM